LYYIHIFSIFYTKNKKNKMISRAKMTSMVILMLKDIFQYFFFVHLFADKI